MGTNGLLIETRELGKTYEMGSEKIEALRQVNLRIERNEYVAIMGPSGSGKSTLMNLLGCLDTPTAGEYLLQGRSIGRTHDEAFERESGIEIRHYHRATLSWLLVNFAEPTRRLLLGPEAAASRSSSDGPSRGERRTDSTHARTAATPYAARPCNTMPYPARDCKTM